MARPSIKLVLALRETALRLSAPSVRYEWSHFGHCNCGHLAQTLTGLSPKLIYDAAFHRAGDWGEQAKELAQVDLGDREAGALRGDAQVAGAGQHHAAADAVTVDLGDRDRRHALSLAKDHVEGAKRIVLETLEHPTIVP